MALQAPEYTTDAPGLWQKLQDRFGLRSGTPGSGRLASTIVPVTQMDDLALLHKAGTFTISVTASGLVTAFTVPQGERWRVSTFAWRAESGGTFTYNWVVQRFTDGLSGPAISTYLDVTSYSADGTWHEIQPNLGGPFCGLDEIGFEVDTFSIAGTVHARVVYMRELCGPNA